MRAKRRIRFSARWHPALVPLVLLGTVILVVLVLENPFSSKSPPAQRLVEQKSNDPALEAKVLEVASKFICACGTCGNQPLDTCTCATAVQERQFIRSYVQGGQTVDDVIVAVNDNFGWMKPEFAPKYGGLSSRLTIPDRPVSTFGQFGGKSGYGNVKLATEADLLEILSQFECPCGQCGIEELKDCECSHPRGAKEVKAFADEKIREGTWTVAQVIDLLNSTYGGRKL